VATKGGKTHLWRRREKSRGADEKQQQDCSPHLVKLINLKTRAPLFIRSAPSFIFTAALDYFLLVELD